MDGLIYFVVIKMLLKEPLKKRHFSSKINQNENLLGIFVHQRTNY